MEYRGILVKRTLAGGLTSSSLSSKDRNIGKIFFLRLNLGIRSISFKTVYVIKLNYILGLTPPRKMTP